MRPSVLTSHSYSPAKSILSAAVECLTSIKVGLIRRSAQAVQGVFGMGMVRKRSAAQFTNGEFSLTALQVAQLIAAASTTRDMLMLRIFAETGIRRSELINLCWGDFDQNRRLLTIRNGKGGKMRLTPITHGLATTLLQFQAVRNVGEYIFTSRQSTRLSPRQVNRIVAGVGRIAAIPHPNPRYRDITPHLFRHTFARLWKARGGSMESLSKVLGHHNMLTTASVYGTESLLDVQRNYDQIIAEVFHPRSRHHKK